MGCALVNTSISGGTAPPSFPNTLRDSFFTTDAGQANLRRVLAGSGTVISLIPTLLNPADAAADAGNTVYVTDQSRHQLKAWNASTGAVTVVAGSGTAGFAEGAGLAAKFNFPTYIALSPTAPVLGLIDSLNQVLRLVSLVEAPLQPPSLAATPTLPPAFSPFEASYGRVVTLAGTPGVAGYRDGTGTTGGVLFSAPAGLACDPGGAVWFVADGGNERIRRVTHTGVVSTLAGSGAAAWVDGSALQASFLSPRGLAMHGSGALLAVTDYGGHRIRSLSCSVGCPVGSWCRGGAASLCPPGVYGGASGLSTPACSGPCSAAPGWGVQRGVSERGGHAVPKGLLLRGGRHTPAALRLPWILQRCGTGSGRWRRRGAVDGGHAGWQRQRQQH
jgi:hypothetical protein